jgi:hypothetical protein
VLLLLVTANIVPSSLILVTLMMEVIRSSETLVLTTATWRNIPEDSTLEYVVLSDNKITSQQTTPWYIIPCGQDTDKLISYIIISIQNSSDFLKISYPRQREERVLLYSFLPGFPKLKFTEKF